MFLSRAKFAKDDAYILRRKIPPAVGQGSWSSVEYLAHRTQRVNRAKQYAYIKTGKNEGYFNNNPLDGDQKYTVNDICKLNKFLVD